jgi:hypothetical protein
MGLFEAIFGRRKDEPQGVAYQTLTAYQPVFRTWGGQIYESEMVRAAIDAHARHAAKLKYSIEGTARQKLYTQTKSAPNPWMTWSQYLERCSNIYQVQNNLFIIPLLDEMGEVNGFYPAVPSECEVVDVGGQPWLKFTFIRGQKKSIPLSRIGMVVKHQLKDDFFGEKNSALNGTMELVNMVNQGIAEGVKNSATFRFMAQLNSKAFDEDLRKERDRFNKNNLSGGDGGLLLYGNQMSNMQQIKQEGYKVDPEQSKLIKDNVMDYFGVFEDLLQNRATGDQMDSFFNGATEVFSIKMSEAHTRVTFTQREINGGNLIKFTANRLQYMSVNAKISMAQQLGDRGILTIDEIRELFNYEPLEDGTGKHVPIRGEYYFADEGKGDKTGGDDKPAEEPADPDGKEPDNKEAENDE